MARTSKAGIKNMGITALATGVILWAVVKFVRPVKEAANAALR